MGLLTVFHIIICLSLISFVLLQDSKGAMGGSFGGGGSNSLLGPTGAPNFLAKITRYVAIIFAVLCIILSKITAEKQGSALDEAASAIPAIPAATAEKSQPAAQETAPNSKKTDK